MNADRDESLFIETWYSVEVSRIGADDWFTHIATSFDTMQAAIKAANAIPYLDGYEFRVTEKVVSERTVFQQLRPTNARTKHHSTT